MVTIIKYIFIGSLILINSALYSQVKNAPKKVSAKVAVLPQLREMSRSEFAELKTVRDLFPGMPDDCIIFNWSIVYTQISGEVKIFDRNDGDDIGNKIKSETVKSLYVNIKSSCHEYESREYKILVKKNK